MQEAGEVQSHPLLPPHHTIAQHSIAQHSTFPMQSTLHMFPLNYTTLWNAQLLHI